MTRIFTIACGILWTALLGYIAVCEFLTRTDVWTVRRQAVRLYQNDVTLDARLRAVSEAHDALARYVLTGKGGK